MQWLITGGAGFIGQRLTQFLRESNQRVRVVDNFLVSSEAEYQNNFSYTNLNKNLIDTQLNNHELVVGDICDAELAKKVCKGIDIIVHLAANTGVQPSINSPRDDFLNNCLGTFNYLEAARFTGVKKFIFWAKDYRWSKNH